MMETLAIVLCTSMTTAAVTIGLYIGFFHKAPEKETKKLERCPTCKRWQEAK